MNRDTRPNINNRDSGGQGVQVQRKVLPVSGPWAYHWRLTSLGQHSGRR